ncbi:MAG: trypsin-like peptidase domain-containing protein [Candidatus Brocadiia bacterium]
MIKKPILILACFAIILCAWSEGDEPDEAGSILFKKVDPAVVAIQHEEAGGSGFIIDPSGYILTNGHVVSTASGSWWREGSEDPTETAKRITVILSDERKFQAKVIGHSLDPDVALIKIEVPEPLTTVALGNSDHVKVGQRSYAFGMPLGLKRTLTAGIVSNAERTDLGTFTKVIQTDAPINPGNSGGPLFNEKGEVLGLNTYGMWGEGLGFTIPINVALVLKDHFLKYGKFQRAALPFFFPKEITADFAKILGVSQGIFVDYVDPGSLAEKAGLKNGDIIVEMNGAPITAANQAQLSDATWKFTTLPVGSKVEFKIKRKDGADYKDITVSGQMVEDEPAINYGHQIGEVKEIRYDAVGLRVQQITSLSRYAYGLFRGDGVRVTSVQRGEPAEKGDVNHSDVILELNDIKTPNIDAFQETLDKMLLEKQKYIRVLVQRGMETAKAVIKPNYDLRNKTVVLILPENKADYFKRIKRYFVSNGATVITASRSKTVKTDEKEITVDMAIDGLANVQFHGLVFLSGEGAEPCWTDPKALELVKNAYHSKRIIGAIGNAAPVLVHADEGILQLKVTSDEPNANVMMAKKANYTGNETESDQNIFTATGFNKEIIDALLAKLRSPIKECVIKPAGK